MFRGVIHCHSTYSDGEFTLRELRERFVAEGLDFVCMTDHAEHFDEDSLRAYVAECESLSDSRFRFVAGLEYNCERRMHVLGYGVTKLVTTTDPQAVIRHIESEGGVSVIAHPMDSMFDWIETFDTLPRGVEAWNTKYDGRYAPRPATFRLIQRLRRRRPDLLAFYGTDLHWRKQYRRLVFAVTAPAPTREALLAAMKAGDFSGLKDKLELPSHGQLPEALLARFGTANARYNRVQKLFKRAKRMSGSFGKSLPAPIKAQLRRIFS